MVGSGVGMVEASEERTRGIYCFGSDLNALHPRLLLIYNTGRRHGRFDFFVELNRINLDIFIFYGFDPILK